LSCARVPPASPAEMAPMAIASNVLFIVRPPW
jgi:hypothetical protein